MKICSHSESQAGVHARAAVGPAALVVDRLDLLDQRTILGRPPALRPPQPVVEAAGRGLQNPTHQTYWEVFSMILDELDVIETHIRELDEELAGLLRVHQDAVQRLAAVPGLGVDSAQQIIAEVGSTAATFATAKRLASWVGACPGHDESAGVNHSHRSPKGNRQMRRLLNQAANAAVKTKGSLFEIVYRRLVVRLGHQQAIGAIAHRLSRLVWKILHDGVIYEERGPAVTKARAQRRAAKMIRELRSLGYRIEPGLPPASALA